MKGEHIMETITNQDLAEKIQHLVNTFNIVETEQVYRMFAEQERARVSWCIKALKTEGKIVQDLENTYIAKHKNDLTKPADPSMIDAIWTMISYGHEKISNYFKLEYPKHVIFIVNVGEKAAVYEVAVIPNDSISTAKAILTAVPEKSDHTISIAVVEEKKSGQALIPYGFDAYCILNADKKPTFYQE